MVLSHLINSWVKVNNKHVIFPRGEGHPEGDQRVASGHGESPRGSPRQGKTPARKHGEHVSQKTAKTTSTTLGDDPELLAIQRLNTRRQNRRRLQRTVSHSDLLREMAKGKDNSDHQSRKLEEESGSMPWDSSTDEASSSHHPKSILNSSVHSAPVFATGEAMAKTSSSQSVQAHMQPPMKVSVPRRLSNTGKYLNEAAFVQQMEQTKAQHRRTESPALEGRRLAFPADADSAVEGLPSSRWTVDGRLDPDENAAMSVLVPSSRNSLSGVHSEPPMRKPPGPTPTAASSGPKPDCKSCDGLEHRLRSTLLDMEYLRSVAMRTEYTCGSCQQRNSSKQRSNPLKSSNQDLSTLEASKRLMEVTAVHRRQIEQMTKERSRWRTDMQVKLSKIMMICKELNEENAVRKQAAAALEADMQYAKEGRNKLASEARLLGAQLTLHEQEQTETALLQDMLAQYEKDALDQADEGIQQRDGIVTELSARLDQTLETLSVERELLRQRRQIIFPASRPSLPSNEPSDEVALLREELRRAKEATRNAELKLEAALAEADRKEAAYRQLKDARN